jgi:hypothetical protein
MFTSVPTNLIVDKQYTTLRKKTKTKNKLTKELKARTPAIKPGLKQKKVLLIKDCIENRIYTVILPSLLLLKIYLLCLFNMEYTTILTQFYWE